ncbi:hypothetical protein GOBAR_AA33512 [Gossypium barbadense]|uniref:Uncharacterized protein n=1 Tax=Gossypium barbadense TaxID=3634 RepID=A0A2P5W7V5_GOSBA|nr:hypothetical protein GOBAR_AA33512 [Gossypium barbadense]
MSRMGLRQLNQLEAGYVSVKEVRKEMVVNAQKASTSIIKRVYWLGLMVLISNRGSFPVLRDVLTWEVPPPKFELILDKRLRRKPKGQPQVTQIHNDMDIWEPLGQKHCGIYRTVDHNQNKCPYRNYHPGRSSRLGGF